MIELRKQKFYIVNKIFDLNHPNISFIKAVIENKIPGRIFVDRLDTPACSLMLTEGPFGFLSKKSNLNSLNKVDVFLKKILPRNNEFKLIFYSDIKPYFSANHSNSIIERVNFTLDTLRYQEKIIQYPSSMRLIRIDNEIFDNCNWRDLMLSFYGTKENYINHSVGYCLVENETIVSEAHAILSNDFAEVGTITHPQHRGRGLSTAVCQEILSYCVGKGLSTKWTCNRENLISNRLAIKLGFIDTYSYSAAIY